MTGFEIERTKIAALLIALLAAGCGAPALKVPAMPPPPPPPDASYDWHVLLVAPFDGALKDMPGTLHEVLLFHDESQGVIMDEAECYATDKPPARFIARNLERYAMCFKHDRLFRIDAAVRVPESAAAQVFAEACGSWLKRADAGTPGADGCAGSEGAVAFSGRLEHEPGEAESELSIQLVATDARR